VVALLLSGKQKRKYCRQQKHQQLALHRKGTRRETKGPKIKELVGLLVYFQKEEAMKETQPGTRKKKAHVHHPATTC
jgi:hypothetical protein